jgi:AcrR family transcriptional regulator
MGQDAAGKSAQAGADRSRPPGRPRNPEIDRAILDSVGTILDDVGYDGLTVEAVAARAGVGRQSVYRRWSSKSALVAASVLEGRVAPIIAPIPHTADLTSDLRAWFLKRAEGWSTSREASLVRGLSAAAADDASTAAALYQRLTGPDHDALVDRMSAAQRRDELRTDADLDAAATALIGGLLYLVLARHQSVHPDHADGLLDVVLGGILVPGVR